MQEKTGSDHKIEDPFGPGHALVYDERWMKMAPMRAALDFLMRSILANLPRESRILCVGAGTGAELMPLAQAYPEWHFTAVEPSAAMLDVCRRKAEAAGFADRCEFHEGYLDSLPHSQVFDGATSILVSQFLTQENDRRNFFQQIARRLRSGALFVSADLASPFSGTAFERLIEIWLQVHGGQSPGAAKAAWAGWGSGVAVLPPKDVASLMTAAGFEEPVLFYQALFIHAWYARIPGSL